MASFHQVVQNLLLIGHKFAPTVPPAPVLPPPALQPLVDAVAPIHRVFDNTAIAYGHRYRSAFWLIYMLSALAVLCAVMPLALGWDDGKSMASKFAVLWVVGEIVIISTVAVLYWMGHRHDWQGQWLAARTKAELAWYVPMIAPLLDHARRDSNGNWYERLFNEGQPIPASSEIQALCKRCEAHIGATLDGIWDNPRFVIDYGNWTAGVLEQQRGYHLRVMSRQNALLHRVHRINTWLFGLTGLAALSHLFIHSRMLTLMTTFLPALGASLHGALAQSEAYRLQSTSERLAGELARRIDAIRRAVAAPDPGVGTSSLRAEVLSAVELILDEHDDWHMLVRPHHLPLG